MSVYRYTPKLVLLRNNIIYELNKYYKHTKCFESYLYWILKSIECFIQHENEHYLFYAPENAKHAIHILKLAYEFSPLESLFEWFPVHVFSAHSFDNNKKWIGFDDGKFNS